MKKRIINSITAVVFFWTGIFSLQTQSASAKEREISVLTSVSDLAYFARRIGKDRVKAESLVRGDQDPHFITARPDFILKASKADIFCQVGLDLEAGWLPVIQRQARNPAILPGRAGYCDASAGVKILEIPEVKTDRSMGDIHLFGNPHYLTDPLNAVISARNIKDALIRTDPEGRDFYEANYRELADDMERLVKEETAKMQPYKGMKVAVYHNEFLYFFKRFGIETGLIIEEKAGVPPSASRLRQAAAIMKRENIRIIALAPYSNPQYAKALSELTGAKVVVLPAATGSEKGILTYEDAIRIMLERLRNAADGK